MADSLHPTFIGTAVSDEANDDFDSSEQQGDPDDVCWLSQDQLDEIFEPEVGEHPKAAQWEDDKDGEDLLEISVAVDKARKFLWNSAKTEIGIIRQAWGENHPSFSDLAAMICGPNSELFHRMNETLGLSCGKFCRFMATFCTASMVSLPVPTLFECDLFVRDGLMDSAECLRICKNTEAFGSGQDDDALWMMIEDCFDNLMKKTFLSKRGNDELHIASDDDKHHFNHSKKSDTCGLKRCRHTKDNRPGHTCHTAGCSGSGLPLCAVFQREGETSADEHRAILKKMFGSRSGEASPNLQGITLHSDGGHLTIGLVFDATLAWGGHIHGAVARAPWCPFTFGVKPPDACGRDAIPSSGCKDVKHKTIEWKDRVLRATACKSGTGAVSLALSTACHSPSFDLNLAFPKDHKHHFDPRVSQESREAKAFAFVAGEDDRVNLIRNLPIRPLTVVQGDMSWFIMRQFALTSSTVDQMTTARAMEITPSMSARDAHTDVLFAIGRRLDILPEEPTADPTETDNVVEPPTPANADRPTEFDGDDVATDWIRRVNELDEVDEFLEAIETLDDGVLRAVVAKHKHSNPTASLDTMKKQLRRWAHCESAGHRKCFWCKVPQLKNELKAEDPGVQKSTLSKGKPFLANALIEADKRSRRRTTLTRAGQQPHANDEVDAVLLRGLQAWFMLPLKDEAKKHCRQGHEMEIPFLKEFHQHSESNITLGCKSIVVRESPLVESTSIAGALDSADGEPVCEKDGIIGVMPAELKARSAHSTFCDEMSRIEASLGFRAWEFGEPHCVETNAESEDFHGWTPSNEEGFQLLHHVAIRNLRKGLIVIGNGRKTMFGVFVNCQDQTVRACREILTDLHERVLKQFCEDEEPSRHQAIQNVIESNEMKKVELSAHSFQTACFIWRQLRVVKSVPLPLPPCNRILPYSHSHWNNQKGVSDTTTKLFWNCRVVTANWASSQSVALGEFFQLFSVALHRWQQIATAKDDLNFHASIRHFRNSRNRHWPCGTVLDNLRKCLRKQADDFEAPAAASNNERENDIPTAPPRPRRDNPRNAFTENRTVLRTGGTPGKGRPRCPKNKTPAWQAHQERLNHCRGQPHKLADGVKQKCFICGTKTACVCLECKGCYCFEVGRDEKIADMILDGKKEVEFLEGKRPAARINVKEFCSAVSSCHHIRHRMNTESSRSPLASIAESLNEIN